MYTVLGFLVVGVERCIVCIGWSSIGADVHWLLGRETV